MIPARTLPLAILVCACHRPESEANAPEPKESPAKASPAKARDATPPPVADSPSDVLRSASSRGDDVLAVQVLDLTAEEEKAIDALLAESDAIAPDDPRMPKRWRIGRAFHFWFADAPQVVTLRGFESGSGGSGTIYTMLLDAKGVRGKGGWVTDVGTRIADAKGKGPDADAAKRAIPALREQMKAGGVRGKISLANVSAMRGAFPAPHTTAVVVNIATRKDDPAEAWISGLLLTDDAGQITGEVDEIGQGIDEYSLDSLLDVGADGIDELVYSTTYYEGQYTHLLRWNGSTPEVETIEGDGA